MGIRDIEPHAARSGGSHLEVQAGTGLVHRPTEDQYVSNQLRHGLRKDERFDIMDGLVPRLDWIVVGRNLRDGLFGDDGSGVDVLVADGRGGVDAIDDHIWAVLEDETGQAGLLIGRIDRAEKIREDTLTGVRVF